jgi:hypothetical protein
LKAEPTRIREGGRSESGVLARGAPENPSDEGGVLGPEWVKQISKMTFMEGESFALPGDVVEDVRRKFGTKRG